MNRHTFVLTALVLSLSGTALTACARAPNTPESPQVSAASAASEPASRPSRREIPPPSDSVAALPLVVVHKSPSCGCCGLWVEHMKQAGFQVEVRNADNVNPVKERLGVPYGKGSCHTAEVGGYFVEGHVPAQDIKRLLAQKPDAKGLVVPGMPLGSPGMEMPDGAVQPYTVELVDKKGATTAFAQH